MRDDSFVALFVALAVSAVCLQGGIVHADAHDTTRMKRKTENAGSGRSLFQFKAL
jgi:hypothetical protein